MSRPAPIDDLRLRLRTAPRTLIASFTLAGLLLLGCDPGPDLDEVRQLQAEGRHAVTIEPLRAMLDDRPDDPELNYRYGVALNRTQSSRVSVWSLRKAAEHPDWAVPARLELASAAIRSGHWDEAIEHASMLLEADPDDAAALMLRGMAYLNDPEQAELALEDFETVLDADPKNLSAQASRAQALLQLGDVEEAETAILALQEQTSDRNDPQREAMMCATGAVLAAEKREENAAERFEACLEAYPNVPIVAEPAIEFFDGTGNRTRATEILAALHEAIPGSQAYRQALSARAVEDGDEARAEAILRAGTTRPDPRTRATAWTDLTNFYLEREQLDAAIEAYQQALALTPNPSQATILQHADLLARAERHEEALEVAKGLEQDAYRGLIESRVHLNEHRPAEALARLETVFPTWPNNAGARYYAARAAEQLGDFERAIEEYRQSIRSAPEQTDASLRLAKLYLGTGALGDAWSNAAGHFRAHPDDPAGVRAMLQAASGADPASVQQLFSRIRGTPLWPTALAIRAERIEASRGADAALGALDELAPDVDWTAPANAELLRTRLRLLLVAGRGEEARAAAERAVEAAPGIADFHEIRALVLETAGAPAAEIRATLERALELDPDAWRALEALARLTHGDGDLEAAIPLYARAAERAPDRASPRQALAMALRDAGRLDEAEAVWEEQLRELPWNAEAAMALAQLRLARGQHDERTVELAERAVLFRGGTPARELLLAVHRARGESARADALEQAFADGRPLPPTAITPIDVL